MKPNALTLLLRAATLPAPDLGLRQRLPREVGGRQPAWLGAGWPLDTARKLRIVLEPEPAQRALTHKTAPPLLMSRLLTFVSPQ